MTSIGASLGAPSSRDSERLLISGVMHEHTRPWIASSRNNALLSADPDDVSAQIDLIGVPWLMIGEEPSAAPNDGSSANGFATDCYRS